jgi:merlin protein
LPGGSTTPLVTPSTSQPHLDALIPFSTSPPVELSLSVAPAAASATLMSEADMQELSMEIEREKHEYLEKSRFLQEQLLTLKNEIDELKLDDKMTLLDHLHELHQEQGDTKYSTIQKVKRGSTQSRVTIFEGL